MKVFKYGVGQFDIQIYMDTYMTAFLAWKPDGLQISGRGVGTRESKGSEVRRFRGSEMMENGGFSRKAPKASHRQMRAGDQ